MGVLFRPIGLPEEEFSQHNESQFRRNLESYLLEIASAVNSSSSANSGEASSASKREMLLSPATCVLRDALEPLEGGVPSLYINGTSTSYNGKRVMKLPSLGSGLTSTISTIDNYVEGRVLTLVVPSGNLGTFTINESGNIVVAGGTSVDLTTPNHNITFVAANDKWIESGRVVS